MACLLVNNIHVSLIQCTVSIFDLFLTHFCYHRLISNKWSHELVCIGFIDIVVDGRCMSGVRGRRDSSGKSQSFPFVRKRGHFLPKYVLPWIVTDSGKPLCIICARLRFCLSGLLVRSPTSAIHIELKPYILRKSFEELARHSTSTQYCKF